MAIDINEYKGQIFEVHDVIELAEEIIEVLDF